MPDITCCMTRDCSRRSSCYRYIATWSARQSLSCFAGGDACGYYIPYGRVDEVRQTLTDARIDKINQDASHGS